jgi:tetratricopeptide (TPR) repeat protein
MTRRQDRRRAGCALLAVFALAGVASAQGPVRVAPGAVLDESLAPKQSRSYRVRLAAGQAVDVAFMQREATLQVRRDAQLYQNDAGRQARLRLTLVADAAGDIVLDVAAKNGLAATYALSVGKPRRAGAHDRERAQGERALATAEQLRRDAGSLESGKGDATADLPARALAAYAAAIAAATAAGDACTAAMAHGGLARWHFAHGDYVKAQREAEAALPTPCGDDVSGDAEAAVAERTLGSALGYQGDLVAATAISERALARYRRTGDAAYQAMLLGNLSANYRVLGESHRALATAQAALDIAQSLGDAKRALFSRESIAAIHLQRGELAPALRGYRDVIDALRTTPYPLIEGMSWNNLGLVYGRLGDRRAQEDAYVRAADVWTRSGDRAGLAETGLNAADALADAGRIDEAEAAYRRALAFDREHRLQREEIHALGGLGRVALARKDWNRAQEHFDAARDLARQIHAEALEAGIEQMRGDLAARRGDAAGAQAAYTRSATLAEHVSDRATRVASQASLARLDAEAGRLATAQQRIETALALIESERAAIPDPQLRTTYFASQRAYYDLYVDVLMRRHARSPREGYAARALEAAERARARALVDLVVSRRIDLAPKVDASLAAALRDAEDARRELAWRLAQLPADAGEDKRDTLREAIDRAERELDAARGRVRDADPRYAALAQPAPLDAAAVQRDLDADTAVIEYWLGETRGVAWRITRDRIDTIVLPPRARIDAEADALRARLHAPGAAAADTSIAALDERRRADDTKTLELAAGLGERVLPRAWRGGVRRLVIVADGKLQLVPFALFAPDADVATVYAPSLTTLREIRGRPRGAPDRAYAVIADPVFRADDPRLPASPPANDAVAAWRSAAPLDLTALPRLRETRREAQSIAALRATPEPWVVTDFAANRRDVLAADWSRYAGVHFATHALVDPRNPELSGIVLSLYDRDGRPDDGFVRAGDVYRLDMPVDLVVLSACDSAVGDAPGAEGVYSLSRAFFYAGARRVVASLWPVDDRAAAEFMTHYYTALWQRGAEPEAALAAAQRELRASPRWRSPTYWSAFVLQGDYTRTAPR